jgi:hypothetical protein
MKSVEDRELKLRARRAHTDMANSIAPVRLLTSSVPSGVPPPPPPPPQPGKFLFYPEKDLMKSSGYLTLNVDCAEDKAGRMGSMWCVKFVVNRPEWFKLLWK